MGRRRFALFSFDQRVAEENARETLERRRNHEPCSGLQRDTLPFFVRDNGLGIAAEYQEKIFQSFKRPPPPAGALALVIPLRFDRFRTGRRGGRVVAADLRANCASRL